MFGLYSRYDTRMFTILGEGDMIYSFFSSISKLLEPNGWGTRFPLILRHLCNYGCVKHKDLVNFALEVKTVKRELNQCTVKEAVYDYEHPELEIPFDKTEYYNENTTLDAAFCRCDEYGCVRFTNILLKSAKLSFENDTNLLLAGAWEDSVRLPKSKPKLYKGVWLKRGRRYYKNEYPIIFRHWRESISFLEAIEKPKIKESYKETYDRKLATLNGKTPIIYQFFIEQGVKSLSKNDIKRFKELLKESIETDCFIIVFVDENSIEENPNKPLDYTKWKGEV